MPNSFTPQQIEQFLQEFFDVVGARQYIGARYVPIFGRAGEDTVEWDDGAPYEPLTVVMHEGVSYVSRRYVPTGIQVTDTDYWVETYRFNAQVEQYRQEVLSFQGQIDQVREDMADDYVPFPDPLAYPKYGTAGQVLSTLTNGATEWVDPVTVDADVAGPLIDAWLTEHPEATTTVQDGSVTDAKLAQSGGILSTVGPFVHRQNAASRVMTVDMAVSSGDTLYFKPLVWGGEAFTTITVSGVIAPGQYDSLGSVAHLGDEKFITVNASYQSLIVNVAVPSAPATSVAFQFILCNASDLDNVASYAARNKMAADSALTGLDELSSTVGPFVHRQNAASRVMTVDMPVSSGDTLYFKPLVWGGEAFTSITVSGVIAPGQYDSLGSVAQLGDEKFITVNASYQSLIVNVGVPSAPATSVAFQFILCSASDLDNVASYVARNKMAADSALTGLDAAQTALNASFKYRGYLPVNANVNTYVTAGWYLLSESRIPGTTGIPDTLEHNAVLMVYPGELTIQTLMEINFPFDSYQRYLYSNNTRASEWIRTPNRSRQKTMWLFGDSITKGTLGTTGQGTSYLVEYGNKLGYTVKNQGIGGIGYVYSAAKPESEVPWNTGGGRIRAQDVIDHFLPELTTNSPDTIILAYGINDWQTLGDASVTITESDRRATSANIEANVKTAISTLMGAVPYCRIIVVTPINSSYRGGSVASGYALETALTNNNDGLEAMTLEKVYQAIVNACEYYGVKYVDMTHLNSVVNYLNINNALPDKLHPAQGTYYRLADDFASRFK